MAQKYSDLIQTSNYDSVLAGAIIGVRFILVDDPKIVFTGGVTGKTERSGVSGFTVNQQIEQNVVETVGHRLPEEIVPGRYAGTASVNGFYSPRKGDTFVPASSTFVGLQWHAYRFYTEGPFRGVPIDAVFYWSIANATVTQGARGLMTFEMSGPFVERLTGKEAAQRLGAF